VRSPLQPRSVNEITLLVVPYHLGREGHGMALGPDAYLDGGLEQALASRGYDVRVVRVVRPSPFKDRPSAIADINAELAKAIAAALREGRLALIAGGNCNVALGAVAGLQQAGRAPAGVVWFDAHGDFNTPTTTPSGFIDGMPLAILTGRCHRRIWARLRRGQDELVGPITDELVVHAGGRDLDPGEELEFALSTVARVSSRELLEGGARALDPALARLGERAAAVYLHIDIDVLDPATAPAVDFPAPHGLALEDLLAAVARVVSATPVRAVSVTAYDPECDDGELTTLALGTRLICGVVESLERSGSR
jgi:arginase